MLLYSTDALPRCNLSLQLLHHLLSLPWLYCGATYSTLPLLDATPFCATPFCCALLCPALLCHAYFTLLFLLLHLVNAFTLSTVINCSSLVEFGWLYFD